MEILWLCNCNTNATSLSMIANYHDFKSVFLLFTIIFGFGGDITLLQVMRHAIQTKLLRKLCFKCFIFPFLLPFSYKHYSLCYSKRYNNDIFHIPPRHSALFLQAKPNRALPNESVVFHVHSMLIWIIIWYRRV